MSFVPRKCVVIPIDFSGESEQAVSTALEMVDDATHVHLVHVMFPLDVVTPGVVWGAIDDDRRDEAVLKHYQEFREQHGLPETTFVTRVGDPGTEIAAYAKAEQADLIVIPSHGYHGLKRMLFGSVAECVIRHAACPVLVLRRTDAE